MAIEHGGLVAICRFRMVDESPMGLRCTQTAFAMGIDTRVGGIHGIAPFHRHSGRLSDLDYGGRGAMERGGDEDCGRRPRCHTELRNQPLVGFQSRTAGTQE